MWIPSKALIALGIWSWYEVTIFKRAMHVQLPWHVVDLSSNGHSWNCVPTQYTRATALSRGDLSGDLGFSFRHTQAHSVRRNVQAFSIQNFPNLHTCHEGDLVATV